MPRGQQKDIDVLKKLVRARGFKIAPGGSGHWKVLDAHGRAVVDESGPLILAATNGEHRSRTMTVNRLVKKGVLLADPWAPDKGRVAGDDAEPVDDAETARREREAEERRAADHRQSERTHAIRERFEPIIANLGGWDKRGMLREVGIVAHYFATHAELPNAWTSAEAAAENADSLRKGATLSPTMAPLWEGLLSDLEAWPDTGVRWFQLLHEAKDLAPRTVGAPATATAPISAAPPATVAPPPGVLPTLALRVAYEIGVGRGADDPYRREVRALIEEVAQLELRRATEPGPGQLSLDEGGADDDSPD